MRVLGGRRFQPHRSVRFKQEPPDAVSGASSSPPTRSLQASGKPRRTRGGAAGARHRVRDGVSGRAGPQGSSPDSTRVYSDPVSFRSGAYGSSCDKRIAGLSDESDQEPSGNTANLLNLVEDAELKDANAELEDRGLRKTRFLLKTDTAKSVANY